MEAAILDHENPRVLDGHIAAAAFEAPLDDADEDVLGAEALRRAAAHPELEKTPAGYVWAGRDYPAARFGLRSTSPDVFTLVETQGGSVLGTIERQCAEVGGLPNQDWSLRVTEIPRSEGADWELTRISCRPARLPLEPAAGGSTGGRSVAK